MSDRCKHIEKSGFNCGSYAFNLYKDGIDQGNLCDVHYWQAKALAQPELCKYGQEPKSCTSSPMDCQCAIDAALAQQEQEPVAWMHIQGRHQELSHFPLDDGEISRGWEQYPLYTTPPQRTWVGLTDEEENEYNYLGPDMHWVIQEIAAKLKELNT